MLLHHKSATQTFKGHKRRVATCRLVDMIIQCLPLQSGVPSGPADLNDLNLAALCPELLVSACVMLILPHFSTQVLRVKSRCIFISCRCLRNDHVLICVHINHSTVLFVLVRTHLKGQEKSIDKLGDRQEKKNGPNWNGPNYCQVMDEQTEAGRLEKLNFTSTPKRREQFRLVYQGQCTCLQYSVVWYIVFC